MRTAIFLKGVDKDGEFYPAILPTKGTEDSAGWDLAVPYEVTIPAGGKVLVDLGLIIKCPRGYMMFALPRSGVSLKTEIVIPNSPGLIDGDYCGENDTVGIILKNTGTEDKMFKRGDKVAQGVLVPYISPDWDVQKTADFAGRRDRGGFGSTGLNTKDRP